MRVFAASPLLLQFATSIVLGLLLQSHQIHTAATSPNADPSVASNGTAEHHDDIVGGSTTFLHSCDESDNGIGRNGSNEANYHPRKLSGTCIDCTVTDADFSAWNVYHDHIIPPGQAFLNPHRTHEETVLEEFQIPFDLDAHILPPYITRESPFTDISHLFVEESTDTQGTQKKQVKERWWSELRPGYYTLTGVLPTLTENVKICPMGHYCPGDGTIHPCPGGTYGDSVGLSKPTCSGLCPWGNYCPSGTSSSESNPCGSYNAILAGVGVFPSAWSTTTSQGQNTQYVAGNALFYCPRGSATPLPVEEGHYSVVVTEYLPPIPATSQDGVFSWTATHWTTIDFGTDEKLSATVLAYLRNGQSKHTPVVTQEQGERYIHPSLSRQRGVPSFPFSVPSLAAFSAFFPSELLGTDTDIANSDTAPILDYPSTFVIDYVDRGIPLGKGTPPAILVGQIDREPSLTASPFALPDSTASMSTALPPTLPQDEPYPELEGQYLRGANSTTRRLWLRRTRGTPSWGQNVRGAQLPAPPGTFSHRQSGVLSLCPAGRYGSQWRESRPTCEGACAPGFFCVEGSVSPYQATCGNATYFCPLAASQPHHVLPGYYTLGGRTTADGGVTPDTEPEQCPMEPPTPVRREHLTSVCVAAGAEDGAPAFGAQPVGYTGYPASSSYQDLAHRDADPALVDALQAIGIDLDVAAASSNFPAPIVPGGSPLKVTPHFAYEFDRLRTPLEPALSAIAKNPKPPGNAPFTTLCRLSREHLVASQYFLPFTHNMFDRKCHGGKYGDEDTRSAQLPCEPGYFCINGYRFVCPPGTYGAESAIVHPLCSGFCREGYYCPYASTKSTEIPCGGPDFYCPRGSGTPLPVDTGYYTVGGYVPSSDDVVPVIPFDPTKPHFRIGTDTVPATEESASLRNHPLTLAPPAQMEFLTPESHSMLRSAQVVCPKGHYCREGRKFACSAGFYGSIEGLSSEECSGICAPGYFCPEGSTTPYQHPCGGPEFYCPAGSAYPIPVNAGYYSTRGHVTVPGLPANTTQIQQARCEPGHYCVGGVKFQCPAGRYGSLHGETRPACEGPAEPGFFTPPGSTSAHAYACGDVFLALVDVLSSMPFQAAIQSDPLAYPSRHSKTALRGKPPADIPGSSSNLYTDIQSGQFTGTPVYTWPSGIGLPPITSYMSDRGPQQGFTAPEHLVSDETKDLYDKKQQYASTLDAAPLPYRRLHSKSVQAELAAAKDQLRTPPTKKANTPKDGKSNSAAAQPIPPDTVSANANPKLNAKAANPVPESKKRRLSGSLFNNLPTASFATPPSPNLLSALDNTIKGLSYDTAPMVSPYYDWRMAYSLYSMLAEGAAVGAGIRGGGLTGAWKSSVLVRYFESGEKMGGRCPNVYDDPATHSDTHRACGINDNGSWFDIRQVPSASANNPNDKFTKRFAETFPFEDIATNNDPHAAPGSPVFGSSLPFGILEEEYEDVALAAVVSVGSTCPVPHDDGMGGTIIVIEDCVIEVSTTLLTPVRKDILPFGSGNQDQPHWRPTDDSTIRLAAALQTDLFAPGTGPGNTDLTLPQALALMDTLTAADPRYAPSAGDPSLLLTPEQVVGPRSGKELGNQEWNTDADDAYLPKDPATIDYGETNSGTSRFHTRSSLQTDEEGKAVYLQVEGLAPFMEPMILSDYSEIVGADELFQMPHTPIQHSDPIAEWQYLRRKFRTVATFEATMPWHSGVRFRMPKLTVPVESFASAHRQLLEGGPNSVFCPAGSSWPTFVPPGHVTTTSVDAQSAAVNAADEMQEILSEAMMHRVGNKYNEDPVGNANLAADPLPAGNIVGAKMPRALRPHDDEFVRDGYVVASKGHYAIAGTIYSCPEGTFGATEGLTSNRCSGVCPAGYFCPAQSIEPQECPDGSYAAPGSASCQQCPISSKTGIGAGATLEQANNKNYRPIVPETHPQHGDSLKPDFQQSNIKHRKDATKPVGETFVGAMRCKHSRTCCNY